MARRNVVVVITTGGTIAMEQGAGGAIPTLTGERLLAERPADLKTLELQIESFSNIPSAHLTVDQLWQLQKTVSDRLGRLYVRGVVVTHGTDTLEESAYLFDYTLPVDKAVVVTGSMRTASDIGYDGRANLWDAVRVAIAPESDGRGTMVVMGEEIHAARYVTKGRSHDPAAFSSPGWGPMGRLYDGTIRWGWSLERDSLPVRAINPDVHLLKVVTGASSLLLDTLVARRVAGIVIEALGGGRLPPWWLPSLRRAIESGIAVVIASRSGRGMTSDRYGYPGAYRDLERLGVVFAEGLSGPKARIRLMCALGGVAQ